MFEDDLLAQVAQWHALGARIAAGINSTTSGAIAVEALTEAMAGTRQGELLTARLIERADRTGEYATDGAASVSAFVRTTANENPAWASARVRIGRALADQLPATSAGWQNGELGLGHAQVIDHATRKVTAPELVAGMDSYLALLAPTMTPKELAAAADDLTSQAAPEETAADNAKRHDAQHLHLSQTMDGKWRMDAVFDAEAGIIIAAAINAFLRKAVPGDDLATENIARRRADALVDVCRQAMGHADNCTGRGMNRHTIVVGLTHQQLLDGLGTAGVEGAGNLPADAARRMACDANIIPAVYGGESQPLDYGRTMRTVNDSLRRILNNRDGGCVFPQCDRPPAMSEMHHRKPWAEGGKTDADQLLSVCLHHHHLVHEGGWKVTIDQDPEHTIWFHPPDGRPPLQGQRRPLIGRHQYPKRT